MRIELIYLHFNHNMLLVSSVNSKLYSSWRCTVYGHSTSPCFFYSYLSATIAYCIFLCCSVLYFALLYLIVFYCSLLLSSAAVQLCKGALQIPLIGWLIDWLTDWLIDWCYCAKSCGDENIVVGQIICKIVTADFIPAAFSVVTDTVKIVQPRRLLLGHENVASSVERCCQAVVWTNSWLCCCNG